jgi:hypothetical protein
VDDTDAAIVALLQAITEDGWRELSVVIDRLATDPRPYEWCGGDRQANGTIQMPWVRYGDTVRAALEWLDRHHLVTQLADWTNWHRRDRFPDAASVDAAPVADAVRLATSIVRGNRFSEGAIAGTLDSGVLIAVLRRFRRWHGDDDRRRVERPGR